MDDMECLLRIPIEGIMLSHDKKVTRDNGVEFMIELLGISSVLFWQYFQAFRFGTKFFFHLIICISFWLEL